MTLLLLTILLTISLESMSEIAKSKSVNFYPKGCYMPDQCKWIKTKKISASIDLICTDLYAKIDLVKLKNSTILCQRTDSFMFYTMNIFFKQAHKTILNNSFELYNLTSFIGPYIWYGYTLSFTNIAGFTADLALDLKDNVMFYDGDFKVYTSKDTLIESCQDLINTTFNTNFPLKKPDLYFSLFFINTRFEKPICPLIFETSKMRNLVIRYMVNSYYKRNWIKFEEISGNRRLNTSIRHLELREFYGLDLTSKIVNQEMFKNTEDFLFDGVINSIQVDLFKGYFPKLKRLQFNPIYFIDVIRKQGIGWLIEINRGLNVDFSNRTSIEANINAEVDIAFSDVTALEFINNKNFHFFYDEDFCLVKDFPFNQFIVFIFNLEKFDTSCSTIWLMQHYPDLIDISLTFHYNDVLKNRTRQVFPDNSLFDSCDFDSRVKICNRSNFKPPLKPKNVYGFELMIISKFLLVAIFTPLVCLFGTVTNMLIILTVTNKKNEKELKEKQYSYMAITSAINMSIFLIQIVTLINECDYPFGLFCSSIRSNIVVQNRIRRNDFGFSTPIFQLYLYCILD